MRQPFLAPFVLLLIAGCGLQPLPKPVHSGNDTGPGAVSDVVQLGDLRIEPGTVDFGIVGLGTTDSQTVVVSNTGSEPIIVRQANLAGDAAFEVLQSTTLPLQLEGGGEVVVELGFTPEAADNYSGSLTLDVNTLDEPYVVSITGAGEGAEVDTDTNDTNDTDPPAGELVAAPTSVNFGDVPTNQVGEVDVVLTNNHSDNILIQRVSGSPANFGYRAGADITLPQVVTPGESRTLTLTFDPSEERGYSGTVDLTLDVSGSADSLSIPVQGVGVEPPCDLCQPIVNVSPNPVQITEPIRCNASSSVTIYNSGDVDLIVSNVSVTNGPMTCGTLSVSGTTSGTLAPGASMGVTIDFAATAQLCTEIPSLARDQNILHIQNNSGQPDYQVEVNAYASCLTP